MDPELALWILILQATALIFLVGAKVRLDRRRNHLLMDNNAALERMTTAVGDAAAALRDLASKVAAGQDVSTQLSALADNLEGAVTAAGEPGTLPPAA